MGGYRYVFDLTVFHPFINFLLECGAMANVEIWPDFDNGVMKGELSFTMSQLEDDDEGLDSKYQDYTYQVIAYYEDAWNPSISHGELIVSYEGEIKQTLKIPQYHGVDHVNNAAKDYYFFGCFRPYVGGYYLDTRGAGYYDEDDDIIGDYAIEDFDLCNALRGWTGPGGYNHNDDQSGSDETGYWQDGSFVAD